MNLPLTTWHWFALAAIMIIVDVALGASFFILCLGICAAIVGGLLKANSSLTWESQLLIFAVSSIACIAFWRFYLKNNLTQSDKPKLNRRSEQYVGRVFTLTKPIENGRGKVTADDSSWTVSGPDLVVNTKVKVIAAKGIILQVEPYSANDS